MCWRFFKGLLASLNLYKDLGFFGNVNEPILIPIERVNARVINEICNGLGQNELFSENDIKNYRIIQNIL